MGGWEACWGERGAVREVEGSAACVAVGVLEGAEAGLDQAVHQADHRKWVEDFLGENLQVHLPGYLIQKKKNKLLKHTINIV